MVFKAVVIVTVGFSQSTEEHVANSLAKFI